MTSQVGDRQLGDKLTGQHLLNNWTTRFGELVNTCLNDSKVSCKKLIVTSKL